MWKKHLTISGILIALALPIYFIDQEILQAAHGGFISLDLRGVLIWSYLLILAIHLLLSSAILFFRKNPSVSAVYVLTIPASVIFLAIGFYGYAAYDEVTEHYEQEARLKARKGQYDAIQLKKWWYEPDAENPQSVHIVMTFKKGGRFSARMDAREKGYYGKQIFAGDMEQQRHVIAGETFTATLKLSHYNVGTADEIKIFFYLFEKDKGSGVGDLSKIYLDGPKKKDNGRDFFEQLPAPSR